jgi:acyl-coenzyme A synthetase/AMP-(fatty) acid ligase
VTAFVVVDPDAGEFAADAVSTHAAASLAPYKRPRAWTVVEELPRNAMGKVRRDVLRERG